MTDSCNATLLGYFGVRRHIAALQILRAAVQDCSAAQRKQRLEQAFASRGR